MRADSGEVLKCCAPERFLNKYLASNLFIRKPREAPEWISGEEASWGQPKAKRSK